MIQKRLRERRSNVNVEVKNEKQEIEEIDEGMLLREADKLAKECLENICVEDSERIEKYVGIVYEPTEKPNYVDVILELYSKKFTPQDVYNLIGAECGVPVIYILQNFEQWKELINYSHNS